MRFSILSLLVVTAIVAVFCIALVQRTLVWAVITGMISYCIIVWAVVGAWSSRGRQRWAWLGFTVGTIVYHFMTRDVIYRLPHYLYYLVISLSGPHDFFIQDVGEEEAVVSILQDAFRIGLGAVGAVIGFLASTPAKTE